MFKRRNLVVLAAAFTMVATLAPAASADGTHPALTPSSVETMIPPGGSFEVEKTVHTPELPSSLDVCLIVDLSGSYNDDLPNIKSLAPGLWDAIVAGGAADLQMGLASFVDYPFSPWGSSFSGDYAYRLDEDLTSDKTTWVNAVDAMITRSGGDFPESQYEAIYQAATGLGRDVDTPGASPGDVDPGQGCSFRANATKVILLTTDASFHEAGDFGTFFPYPGPSEADVIGALTANDITVIGLKAPGAGAELDALAAATGGSVQTTSSNSSDIADAILAGLGALTVEASMTSDCASPISTSFAPDTRTVLSGEDATFTETISVAPDASPGTYTCKDWALIDGAPMRDAAGAIIYETKTIHVPVGFVTGGGNVTEGRGKDRVHVLSFGGNAGYLVDGTLQGHWTFTFHDAGVKIHTTEILTLDLVDTGLDPAPPEADFDTAIMTAEARVRVGNDPWLEGCTVGAVFVDDGEPQNDAVLAIDLDCGSFAFADADLTGGNIQMHEGVKD